MKSILYENLKPARAVGWLWLVAFTIVFVLMALERMWSAQ